MKAACWVAAETEARVERVAAREVARAAVAWGEAQAAVGLARAADVVVETVVV